MGQHVWLVASEKVLPAFVLLPSQAGVVTFDPLRFPGHRVAVNLQLSVGREEVKSKVKRWRRTKVSTFNPTSCRLWSFGGSTFSQETSLTLHLTR